MAIFFLSIVLGLKSSWYFCSNKEGAVKEGVCENSQDILSIIAISISDCVTVVLARDGGSAKI